MSAAGRYSCIATSESGLQTQISEQFEYCSKFCFIITIISIAIFIFYFLIVYYNAAVPVIVSTDFTSYPKFGELLFIECTVYGIPMPVISWMKDGAILDEITDNRIKIVTIPTRRSSRVEILEASISDDGMYECNASNKAGSVSTPFLIKLQQSQS